MNAGRVVRAVGRSLVALASAAVLVAAGLAWTLQHRLDDAVTSDALTGAEPVADGQAFTALLVGLDARTDASGNPLPPALLDALHAGPDEGQLHTDTIILLHVPAGSGAAVAISIPRDSYVPIAGVGGTHKINSAYRRGLEDAQEALTAQGITGAELDRRGREAGRRALVATVEELTGVGIDHFAEINLAGFVELTETLGGVPVCLNAPARDSYSGVDLPAGPQTVSGAGALAFVRQRHGLEGGDLDRIARQQAFIAGLGQRLAGSGTLSDPMRLDGLVRVVTRYVVLDRGWDLDQALAQFRRLAGGELTFRTIPTGRPDLRTPVDGIAVEIDPVAVRGFVQSLVSGAPPSTASPSTASPTPPPAVQPAGAAPAAPARSVLTTTPAVPTTASPPATGSPPTTGSPPVTASPTPSPRVISTDGIPCVD